ncbi:MAG TPA: DUF2490 domain-containing protein [Pyrinomonadaceae bacterium]|nr:DUF2490 domain-containing protein [Pyrinomonadaceae bacterium]
MLEKLPGRRRKAIQQPLVWISGLFLLVLLIDPCTIRAQEPTPRNEFWPSLEAYINVKPKVRLYLLGTVSKSIEDGELFNAQSYEAQIGAHVDYIPNDHFILRAGYRYGRSVGNNDDGFREHRLVTEQMVRKLLPGDLLLTDRNREDFRFINGDFSFRYRNRVMIEREFQLNVPLLRRRTITPYVSGEISFDTRFGIWNRNRYAVGVVQSLRRGPIRRMLLPKRQVNLDIYLMRQNDSRSSPSHVNALGASLIFHF